MTGLPRLTRHSPVPRAGIVHLGPGAFFKAFNASYTDDVLRARRGDWGIVAVSLQSDRAARELAPQGCAFTSVALEAEGETPHVIEAISKVMVAREDCQAVLDVMADPQIRIVSLTITEKGYCRNPATGALQVDAPEIQADLANPANPLTAMGFIVGALARRRAAGHRPFTVLSCDNLPDNGATARRVVVDFAKALDPDLAAWIEAEGRFPATMVDRITPATTPEDIARTEKLTGFYDPACVLHEPFRQWVIEDDFADGRPDWDLAGAQFVKSVEAHELMKLRCLNGTHSSLAYLGYLAGHETISDVVSDPVFAHFCKNLWRQEILPTVPQPEGEDLTRYTASLFERYRNPAIRHRTWQIAMDGSQKLPQRILGTIADRLARDQVPTGLCLTVAAWMRYVGGKDEQGAVIDVRDPMAGRFRALSGAGGTAAAKVERFLEITDIFPAELARDQRFIGTVTQAYEILQVQGARAAVASENRMSS